MTDPFAGIVNEINCGGSGDAFFRLFPDDQVSFTCADSVLNLFNGYGCGVNVNCSLQHGCYNGPNIWQLTRIDLVEGHV
jgi:hypothetical protein